MILHLNYKYLCVQLNQYFESKLLSQLIDLIKHCVQQQIDMLQMLKTVLKPNIQKLFLRPKVFHFSSAATDLQTAKLNLSNVIEKQLKEQMKAIPNPKSFQLFFEKQGWKIQRNNAHMQIKKQTEDHQFLMVMTIKPPMQMNQKLKQQHIQSRKFQIQKMKEQLEQNKQLKKYAKQLYSIKVQQEFQESFSQIAVFIKKKSILKGQQRPNKYMCLEYVGNSKIVQLQQINFLNSLIKNRISRIKSSYIYEGRPLGFINAQNLQQFGMIMVMDLKLTHQHLKNAIQLNWAYEHQEYLKWMKNIKELL